MSNKIQIGNITSGYRPIKNGDKYNRYFPKPDVKDRVIIEDGEVSQTVELMKKVVWKYIDDTKKIAPLLKGNTVAQSCDNIWNFLYHHIQYQLDQDGLEQLRRPARSWHERNEGIDCDCFSIFASSILTNLGIPHKFRITKYDRDVYQHVYVVVPNAGGNHIIDPVLSKANYEKPYSQKKDFTMSINGINVAVLSGPGEQDLFDAVLATHLDGVGLGTLNEKQELDAMYRHLVSTRNAVAQNPELIATIEDPKAFLKMLNYAIKYWNSPNRDRALSVLSRIEDQFNIKNGLSGIEDEFDSEDEELLGSWFSKRIKGFFRHIKKVVHKIGKGLSKLKKPFIRFNPLTIAARGGFLLALKLNIKKMASKLKWAYASRQQAAKHGISESYRQRSISALKRIEKLFVGKLYGKSKSLKKAILKGKAGNLNGIVEEDQDLQGLGIVFTTAGIATAVAAAVPIIVKVIKVLKSSGLMKKHESAKVSANQIKAEAVQNASVMRQYKSAPAQNPSYPAPNNYNHQTASYPPASNTGLSPAPSSNKLLAFIKKNPLVLVGGVAALGGAGYLIYSQSHKKKSSSLKGVSSKKKSRRKSRKRPTIKTIKLS